MRDFLAFLIGVWTVAFVLVAQEGAMPGIGWVLFGAIFVLGILAWIGERYGQE